MANGNFGGGNGSTLTPYIVEDYQDLKAISSTPSTSSFIQSKDIDCLGEPALPSNYIGSGGFYDGMGYKILNAKLGGTSRNGGAGFFGVVEGGAIQNVHLVNCSSTPQYSSSASVSLLVGILRAGRITSCSVSGSIISTNIDGGTGGICGSLVSGEIKYCSSHCDVVSNNSVGGFVGVCSSSSSIKDCLSTGDVTGNTNVGGFVGLLNSSTPNSISRCYSSGNVTAYNFAGGFSGKATNVSVTANDCYALGSFVKRVTGQTGVDFGAFAPYADVGQTNYVIDTLSFMGGE